MQNCSTKIKPSPYHHLPFSRCFQGEPQLANSTFFSSYICLLPPSITVCGIVPVEFTCLTVFPQSLSKFSLVYLLAWQPPLHTPCISSLNYCLLSHIKNNTIFNNLCIISDTKNIAVWGACFFMADSKSTLLKHIWQPFSKPPIYLPYSYPSHLQYLLKSIWHQGLCSCWDAGVVVSMSGSRCRLAYGQLMPLPLTIFCSSKSRLVVPSWFYLSGASSPR